MPETSSRQRSLGPLRRFILAPCKRASKSLISAVTSFRFWGRGPERSPKGEAQDDVPKNERPPCYRRGFFFASVLRKSVGLLARLDDRERGRSMRSNSALHSRRKSPLSTRRTAGWSSALGRLFRAISDDDGTSPRDPTIGNRHVSDYVDRNQLCSGTSVRALDSAAFAAWLRRRSLTSADAVAKRSRPFLQAGRHAQARHQVGLARAAIAEKVHKRFANSRKVAAFGQLG